MKVAVISDIHGNVPALERVLEDLERFEPDRVVVAGDVVSRGPCSRDVLRLLASSATPGQWQFLRGNHEDYVAYHVGRAPTFDRLFELNRMSYWTTQQIGVAAAREVGRWVRIKEMQYGLRATHGSMDRNDNGIFPFSTDDEIRERIGSPPQVFVTAHTHIPMVRKVDRTLVVNAGSVGTPFDGDVRASYARLWHDVSGWRAEIIRLPYDRAQTDRDFDSSGFLDEAGGLVRIVYEEWQRAQPMTIEWMRRYRAAYLAEEVELEASVDQYLALNP
ncbi:MAG: metallophosphoesterase family protein [Myxococcota bacterium]